MSASEVYEKREYVTAGTCRTSQYEGNHAKTCFCRDKDYCNTATIKTNGKMLAAALGIVVTLLVV